MQKAIDKTKKLVYIIVAKRKKKRGEKMNKYRELVELKGILREKKVTYDTLSKYLKMSLSALSNKINGKSIFTLTEVIKICELVGIPKENIYVYFF